MNTKAKAILASTLLTALSTALVVGQTAIAGQDVDSGYYEAETATTVVDKVNYSISNDSPLTAELDAELFPQGEGQ